ncbi:MAG: hypothetical protein RSP_18150 [Rhodanobacter sp.]
MSTESRFEVYVDGYEFNDVDLSEATSAEEAWDLVTDWLLDHSDEQLDEVHTKTIGFAVSVTDTDDDSRFYQVFFVHPDEPSDADGEWEYLGRLNNIEYRVCDSTGGEDRWYWIEDENNPSDFGGLSDRTYTQDTSMIPDDFKFIEEDEARFTIEIDGEEVDEREVCLWEGIADLDDIEDADQMLDAVQEYLSQGRRGSEPGTRFEIAVVSKEDDEDTADGWVEF